MKFITCLIILFSATTAFCAGTDAFQLIAGLCDSLLLSVKDTQPIRLAVLPFSDKNKTDTQRGQAVAEQIISSLSRSNRVRLVERTDFQKMAQEIALSQTDLIDEATVVKAGKIMAADAILTGSISEAFGSCRINAKIIKTETGEILSSASAAVAPAALDNITRELLGEKVQVSSSIFRSLLVPGWGQFYADKPARGTISLLLGAGALGYLGYTCAVSAGTRSDLKNHKESGDGTKWVGKWDEYETKLRSLENNHYEAFDRAIVGGVITAAAWAFNLIDASIAGVQAKRKFQPYFAAELNGEAIYAGIILDFNR